MRVGHGWMMVSNDYDCYFRKDDPICDILCGRDDIICACMVRWHCDIALINVGIIIYIVAVWVVPYFFIYGIMSLW